MLNAKGQVDDDACLRRLDDTSGASRSPIGPMLKVGTAAKANDGIIGRRLGVQNRAAGRGGIVKKDA